MVGEYPGGDRVPGGALGVGPGSVGFSVVGEPFAEGIEQVVGEGGGLCGVALAWPSGLTTEAGKAQRTPVSFAVPQG